MRIALSHSSRLLHLCAERRNPRHQVSGFSLAHLDTPLHRRRGCLPSPFLVESLFLKSGHDCPSPSSPCFCHPHVDAPRVIPLGVTGLASVLAGLSVPYTSAFDTPFRTGTDHPCRINYLPVLPGRNHHPDGSRISEQKKIDRAPCRSDRPQALNPSGQPAMLVCWIARLSIRQQTSGASPCEAVAQSHEYIGPDESELSGNVFIVTRQLKPYHGSSSLTSSGAAAPNAPALR